MAYPADKRFAPTGDDRAAVLRQVKAGTISQGTGTARLGMCRDDFLKLMAENGFPAAVYGAAALAREVEDFHEGTAKERGARK
ncbi:hypothetical protein JN531_006850 [Flagellatimonas centrodinii]|uniref:hypothetical protein n=1 Tax=Flagellatimonas centrodinii TaxID=2806210 RepID=UPI001FEFB10E|nr:hypothetical protein [Flagellatimonas centrodinii]ULQ48005.1 hypothetical protein JN531_006850 [Flagellatimonas centrodinii]